MRSGSRCRWSRWRTAAARARRACGAGCRTRPAAPPAAPPRAPPACCAATPGSARPASRPGWWPASQGSLRAETTTQLCSQGLEKRIWEFAVHREVVLAHEVPCWCWWRDAALGGRRVAEATEPGPTSQKKGGCRESLPAPPTVMATAGTAGRPSLWSSSWAASRSGCRARGSAGTPWGASSPSSSAAAGGGAGPWSSCCTVDNGTQFRYCSRSIKEKIFNDHLQLLSIETLPSVSQRSRAWPWRCHKSTWCPARERSRPTSVHRTGSGWCARGRSAPGSPCTRTSGTACDLPLLPTEQILH